MNEILRDECGEYFFPERFFLAPKNEKQSSTAHVVTRSVAKVFLGSAKARWAILTERPTSFWA